MPAGIVWHGRSAADIRARVLGCVVHGGERSTAGEESTGS
jgi:hypothetical protein